MFGVARVWDEVPYAKKVATALLREGFDPKPLDEMHALGSFTERSRIFRFLAEKKLKPAEAALAIRLASYRYQATRRMAEAQGWPLKKGSPRVQSPHEDYFLELLDEAAEILRDVG